MRLMILCCLAIVALAFAQPGEVVVYYSCSINTYVQDALSNLGWSYTGYDDTEELAFQADVANGADVVVYSCPSNYEPTSMGVLDTYVNGGGRLIMSFWGVSQWLSSGLWSTMEIVWLSDYYIPLPFYAWETSHDIFNSPNIISFPLDFNDDWVLDGQRLNAVTDAGVILGGYTNLVTTGEGSMILGNDGHTIFNGFCIDAGIEAQIVPLIENELIYIWEMAALEQSTWGSIKTVF